MRDKGLEEVENFNLAYNENNKNNHKKGVKKMHEYSAGSIVYRIKNNKIEFLLVQSRLNRTWEAAPAAALARCTPLRQSCQQRLRAAAVPAPP